MVQMWHCRHPAPRPPHQCLQQAAMLAVTMPHRWLWHRSSPRSWPRPGNLPRSSRLQQSWTRLSSHRKTPTPEMTQKLSSGRFGADFGRTCNADGLARAEGPGSLGPVFAPSAVCLRPKPTPNRPEDDFWIISGVGKFLWPVRNLPRR
jgi:hypothetical protein